ncbi:MAG: ABC transporter permease [Chloroherpetonaceae bacterium]|nr:ABC transporter permease [Chthonomonadaceae bacterium]MDW8207040.1 ABC transporter permease [Chloroherpetonaceae bacterium]
MPVGSGETWALSLMVATLYSATPLVLAALGGVLSERAGVINIALEGLILAGAFVGAWAGQSAPIMGLAGAVLAGALIGLLHAFLTQTLRMNPVVSGLGITLLASGVTRYLALRWFEQGFRIDGLPGGLFLGLALILPFVTLLVLHRTRFGVRLRAVGENPESARMAGVAPVPLRYLAVTLSGVLAALAGAYLSMSDAHTFSSNMSAGKGYIALAAVIFGKWHPLGASLGALFFGFFYAVQTQLQISGVQVHWLGVEWTSPFLLDCLPYLMTLAALVSVVGRAVPPAALGKEVE